MILYLVKDLECIHLPWLEVDDYAKSMLNNYPHLLPIPILSFSNYESLLSRELLFQIILECMMNSVPTRDELLLQLIIDNNITYDETKDYLARYLNLEVVTKNVVCTNIDLRECYRSIEYKAYSKLKNKSDIYKFQDPVELLWYAGSYMKSIIDEFTDANVTTPKSKHSGNYPYFYTIPDYVTLIDCLKK